VVGAFFREECPNKDSYMQNLYVSDRWCQDAPIRTQGVNSQISVAQILLAEFSTNLSTITSLLHHIMHLDPLPDHPKSSIGCIKIICDGWEAMVLLFVNRFHGLNALAASSRKLVIMLVMNNLKMK
jgi:hypothetical protein